MHMLPIQLYIIRHAWAEECGPDQDDYDRRLTKKGRKRFEQFIRFMQGFGLEGQQTVVHDAEARQAFRCEKRSCHLIVVVHCIS